MFAFKKTLAGQLSTNI